MRCSCSFLASPLVPGVAAPVGAGDLHQLEGVAQLAGRGQVRADAKIEPVALAVDRDLLVPGQGGDVLGLVLLARLLEVADRLVPVPDLARDRLVALDDLVHARLDLLQVLGREGLGAGEVVVEAVLDSRPEGHLGARVELLHRLGHDVGAVVAQQLQGVGMAARDNLDRRVLLDHRRQIDDAAVQLQGERRLGQARADRGRDLGARNGLVEVAHAAVRERDGNHGKRGTASTRNIHGGGNLEGIKCLSSQALVKPWSSPGQTLAKPWGPRRPGACLAGWGGWGSA
jgi:hypothetical protein